MDDFTLTQHIGQCALCRSMRRSCDVADSILRLMDMPEVIETEELAIHLQALNPEIWSFCLRHFLPQSDAELMAYAEEKRGGRPTPASLAAAYLLLQRTDHQAARKASGELKMSQEEMHKG